MKFIAGKTQEMRRLHVSVLDGGLNLRDEPAAIADNQLSDADNVWCHRGALRSRPGMRSYPARVQLDTDNVTVSYCRENTAVDTVDGVRHGRRFVERADNGNRTVTFRTGMLYCEGDTAYSPETVTVPMLGDEVSDKDHAMVVEYSPDEQVERLLFLGNQAIYAQRQGEWVPANEFVYVPLVFADGVGVDLPSRIPPAGSVPEQRNLLTPKFRARFTTDDNGRYFFLPYSGLTSVPVSATWVNDQGVSFTHVVLPNETSEPVSRMPGDGYRMWCHRETGTVYFTNEGGSLETLPYGESENNLEITASKNHTADQTAIFGCRFNTFFGGNSALLNNGMRLFLSGNPDHPDRLYWSAAGDPLYFPAGNYCDVGAPDQAITAFGKQDNLLVVFKEREVFGITSAATTAYTDKAGERLTLRQYHSEIGCDLPYTVCLCGGRLVWATRPGRIYMLTGTNSYARCTIRRLSALIEPALEGFSPTEWETASAAVFCGHYMLTVCHNAFLLRADESTFYRYTYAYSDEKAQKQLSWTRWSWDADLDAVLVLAKDDGAVLVASQRILTNRYRVAYSFDGNADTVFSAPTVTATKPVVSRFVSKPFNFDAPHRRKSISTLQLHADNGADGQTTWSVVTEAGATAPTEAENYGGSITLFPPRRKNECIGLRGDSVGEVAVRDLVIAYRLMK